MPEDAAVEITAAERGEMALCERDAFALRHLRKAECEIDEHHLPPRDREPVAEPADAAADLRDRAKRQRMDEPDERKRESREHRALRRSRKKGAKRSATARRASAA